MLRVIVEMWDYDSKQNLQVNWLLNPDHIVAVQFCIADKPKALVYLTAPASRASDWNLTVTDLPSIDRLSDLERSS